MLDTFSILNIGSKKLSGSPESAHHLLIAMSHFKILSKFKYSEEFTSFTIQSIPIFLNLLIYILLS